MNAVGLAFVLDIDELVYATLLPVQLQELVKRMDPVPIGRRKEVYGISFRYFSRLLLFFALVIGGVTVFLLPFITGAMAASSAICDGNTQFHWEIEEIHSQMLVLTDPSSDTSASDCMFWLNSSPAAAEFSEAGYKLPDKPDKRVRQSRKETRAA